MKAIPLSLYIHIPWCVRKCPYCDFNSHAARDDGIPERAYVDTLLADLDREMADAGGCAIQTVFFGGGTPSLFSAESIARILDGVRAAGLASDAEITLEANPGTAEAERFAGYRNAGVNRLSIGCQSFDNTHLKALGRIHSADEAIAAAGMARDAGFENFNLDLMFALPGQDVAGAMADLDQAIALSPAHLSWYQLTLEPNTLFHARPPELPDEDSQWAIFESGLARLQQAGYAQYEVSAHARQGRQCRHNLNYWQFGDYLGIGAGAHGKITASDGTIHRRWKRKHPRDYMTDMARDGSIGGDDRLDADTIGFEFLMNGLRLNDGFSPHLFTDRTALPLSWLEQRLRPFISDGLLLDTDNRIRTSAHGRLQLDGILAAL